MADEQVIPEADQTAVRVALWRALHLEVDGQPPVLADPVGLRLADPADGWRERPDMDPVFTRGFRAAIVARARFIEDLVTAAADSGVGQYVLLGAGLDTFVERRPEYAGRLRVFEIDQPAPQAWKRQRLTGLGYGVPAWLRLVPVDFEAGASWWDLLAAAGFSPAAPAVVASTGVSMYLTREANAATLLQLAALAPGSTVAMTFLLPAELLDEQDRQGLAMALLYQVIAMAREAECRAVAAEVTTDNFPAVQLLAKCGFEVAGLDARRHSNHDLVKEAVTLFWYAPLD